MRGKLCAKSRTGVCRNGWSGGPARINVNADGAVNVLDLIDLLLEFGATCP